MSADNAVAMACEPPLATTQPSACAATISISPTALVMGPLSRANACAATPAQSAFVVSVRHIRPSVVAGSSERAPKRANVNGWRGSRKIGWVASASKSSKREAIGSNNRRQR